MTIQNLTKLVALFSQADSHNAEYAAVRRLARAHKPIAAGAEDIAIGIIYYMLDPMICMGVENVAHVESFLRHPALREQLDKAEIHLIQCFIAAHAADITHMIRFIGEINELDPKTTLESEAKTMIGAALLRHCAAIGDDLAKIIVDDVYTKNSWLWG
ncbi:hypothetical protein F8S13_20645 [Chloroflexia bacterium SDU3-3]|nr:hypothetical protein F8S13_20645 [Chloroflexia bacterium SDU3-3]